MIRHGHGVVQWPTASPSTDTKAHNTISTPLTHHRFPALGAEAYDPEACSTDLGREVVHRNVRRRADEHLKAIRTQSMHKIHATGPHTRNQRDVKR